MENDVSWILGMVAIGIAISLFVYGNKIIYALGHKLVKITLSREVAIELSSALVIITCSRLKMPLPTTHCRVGTIVGVGLLENTKNYSDINCNILFKIAIDWLITCIILGLTDALLISQGVYAPSIFKEVCTLNITGINKLNNSKLLL
jgi:solute carrier family 20 (sodium-dependent phosphate transporter)